MDMLIKEYNNCDHIPVIKDYNFCVIPENNLILSYFIVYLT